MPAIEPTASQPRIGTFEALSIRDFRLYFAGQLVSITGNNAQTVAVSWLVLQITNSGTALGIVTALQYLPLLLLAPVLGSIPDRFPKRRVLITTQVLAFVVTLALWLLTQRHNATPLVIGSLAFTLGIINAIDNPTRQALVRDLVGERLLPNALALNNVLMGSARIAGPAIAALIIATAGIAYCFLFNAFSFVLIAGTLLMLRAGRQVTVQSRSEASFSSGIRYVSRTPEVRSRLILMAVVGTFTYEFWVTLPILVRDVFVKGSSAYGLLMAIMSVGSILGGLLIARRGRNTYDLGTVTTVAFGATTTCVGLSPTFTVACIGVFLMGMAYSAFVTVNSALLQRHLDSRFRGRVMGLWTSAFMGSTAVGGPVMGSIAQQYGVRTSLILGGLAAVIAAFWIGRNQWPSTAN